MVQGIGQICTISLFPRKTDGRGPLSLTAFPTHILRSLDSCHQGKKTVRASSPVVEEHLCVLIIESTGYLCRWIHRRIVFVECAQCKCGVTTLSCASEQETESFPSVLKVPQTALPYLNIITLIKYLISKPLKLL